MLNLVLDMRLFILLIAYLSCQQLVGQCVMQITDTTHVNCFGESSGSFLLDIVAESPYTITLSTGEASVNGSGFSNLIAGNYEIVLVDNQQCVDTLQIKIKEPRAISCRYSLRRCYFESLCSRRSVGLFHTVEE